MEEDPGKDPGDDGHDTVVEPCLPVDDRRRRFEAAFALAYEPLQRYVYRRCETAAVDDVVAETLLVLWRRIDGVPEGLEVAWTFGVARRVLSNHRRGRDRRERLVQRLTVVGGSSMVAPDASAATVADDDLLHDAIGALDEDDAEVVRLWAWEELAPREIAVVLGITANAASIRLHRARRRLADELAMRKSRAGSGHEGVGNRPTAKGGQR